MVTPKLIASGTLCAALALQSWGAVNIALTETIVDIINHVRPYNGPIIISLCLWIIAKINENTKITRERIARSGSETATSEAEPLQRDSVSEQDV